MNRKRTANSKYIEFFYCICKGSYTGTNASSITCKICKKQSHRICIHYNGPDKDFECMLCKVQLLDPFNTVEDFLWYDSLGNTTKTFTIDATNIKKWRSQNKDIYMASIPFNKEKLQHEWPKSMELKINSDIIHVVKEPTWEHKRRDNPIKITYAMRPGKNAVEISSSTYNETEPLFLVIMFLSKQVTVDRIIDIVKKKHVISYDDSLTRISTIINRNVGDDDIVCMEHTHRIDLNCPVTMDRITIPTRGRYCEHIQCYDLDGYLRVMEKTSAFNMRWRCPECQLIVKPYDLVIDSFVQKIIHDVPPSVSRVELDKDANYTIFLNDMAFDSRPVSTLQPSSKLISQNDTNLCMQPFDQHIDYDKKYSTNSEGESYLNNPGNANIDHRTDDLIILDSDDDINTKIQRSIQPEVIYISDHDSSNTEDSMTNIASESAFYTGSHGFEYSKVGFIRERPFTECKDTKYQYTLTPESQTRDNLGNTKRELNETMESIVSTDSNTVSKRNRNKSETHVFKGKSIRNSTLTASSLISEGSSLGSLNENLVPYSVSRDSVASDITLKSPQM
ncbi:hypothetical protein BEWA_019690 [Theileria equi strain WA]|uniref:SP-RING-type domain-containing protein n=1 Tax=Theileria equi strain WA TaxID=1537102 RepID=L0AV44_THEEQ|nr:hypothetical protein BEWA_019690 [Theileria equi strain WA]AFZ79123.1 hypothetical protein BEWA_019690 [Theileria equi strain WA]|eukprot:XP_004828789.1 hypothetical protein BEWA_019690 [Theileria equi strain WA]